MSRRAPFLTDAGLLITFHNRQRNDDSTVFLGDGSLAGVPAPKLHQRGIRSVIKVVDDRCLYVTSLGRLSRAAAMARLMGPCPSLSLPLLSVLTGPI